MAFPRFFKLSLLSLLVAFLSQSPVIAQESKPQPVSPPNPPEAEYLKDLASRLLQHTGKAGCHKGDCTILVMNFVLPDGFTSRYCMHLADELSSEIGNQQKSVRMIDRALLQTVLERERISSQLQNEEPVARWLGKTLNATTVLVGSTKRDERGSLQLFTQLLSVTDRKHSGPRASVSFWANEEAADLTPTDGLSSLPPVTFTASGERAYDVHRDKGVAPPSCSYMPNPSYTDEARSAKFSGIVLEEGIIKVDGTVEPLRVVRGAPFGLNEAAFNVMTTWRCRPATSNGKPVPTLVGFEFNFRID